MKPNHFFTSKREQQLWCYAALIISTIYATLGLAQMLAKVLRNRGLFDGVFAVGMLLIILAIVAQAFKIKRSGIEIVVFLGIIGVYLIVLARMAIPEERSHLIEYSVLALFILEALQERAKQGRSMPMSGLSTIVITSILGIVDEYIQALLPHRVFDYRDILFNCLAACMAVGGSLMLTWVHHKVRSL